MSQTIHKKSLTVKILSIFFRVIKTLFLTYAVLFSIVATIAIIWAIMFVGRPYWDVKKLVTTNPTETRFMKSYRSLSPEVGALRHSFIPLDSISPYLSRAVLAAEDDGFYSHPGFDLEAMLRAIEDNKHRKPNRQRGASTITQQLAKNLFVGGEKNFGRKYLELGYAVLMEALLGKDRILELYLNYAQWGKNIFGCEAAAQQYFGKSAKNLTLSESARLAATLAMPSRLNPNNTESAFIQKRMTVIANNMYLHRNIDRETGRTLGGTDSVLGIENSDTVTAEDSLSDNAQ